MPGQFKSLKGTVPRDSRLFFMNQFSPSIWVYVPLWPFQIFLKIPGDISGLKVHHRCHCHRWQIEINLQSEKFNYFVWTPLGSRNNIYIYFCLQIHSKESAAWYCFHILPQVLLTPVTNLPPLSLIPVVQLDLQIFPWICKKILKRS